MVKKDHEAVNVQALDLVKKLNVTPEDNPTSQALPAKAAEDKRTELGKLEGAAFDKAYVDNEVAYHKQVNDALQTLLHSIGGERRAQGLAGNGAQALSRHISSMPSSWSKA